MRSSEVRPLALTVAMSITTLPVVLPMPWLVMIVTSVPLIFGSSRTDTVSAVALSTPPLIENSSSSGVQILMLPRSAVSSAAVSV